LAKIMWVQRNMKWNYGNTIFIKNCVSHLENLINPIQRKISLYHPWQDEPFQNYSSKTYCEKQNGFQFGSTPNHFDWYDYSCHGNEGTYLVLQCVLAKLMIWILQLDHCCNYFEPWKRNLLMNLGFYLNMNHIEMHFFKDWWMEVQVV